MAPFLGARRDCSCYESQFLFLAIPNPVTVSLVHLHFGAHIFMANFLGGLIQIVRQPINILRHPQQIEDQLLKVGKYRSGNVVQDSRQEDSQLSALYM